MREGRRRGASGGLPILLLLALLFMGVIPLLIALLLLLMGVAEDDLTGGLGGALDLYTRTIIHTRISILYIYYQYRHICVY